MTADQKWDLIRADLAARQDEISNDLGTYDESLTPQDLAKEIVSALHLLAGEVRALRHAFAPESRYSDTTAGS